MLITRTVTKKILETIVHETFAKFGAITSSSLLDSLKLLGFHYATNAGISINIEDLKTPDVKKNFIGTANNEIDEVSKQWQKGFVSDTERFQSIIDSWNIATESLKNRIVDYYQVFDPANNLYIMAFSGARGNMSQVRQLVGMRGLMADQNGKIIDLPIQANFREGLSSIDYIISSYGARKGIVDTALKTADSGYLTRRLIYVAQDLIIRQVDCKTRTGLIVHFRKNTNTGTLLGRSLLTAKATEYPYHSLYDADVTLTDEVIKELQANTPLILKVRSALTCQTPGSICQRCYGWDLAQRKLISLGEAVGIIAAQSIGEPGTQLTMRTFHTGGIFTSESLKQVVAPFSGKIMIPKFLKTISCRTNHGVIALKLQQETRVTIVNWKGMKKDVFLPMGSYLYVTNSTFVKKGQVLSEYSNQSPVAGKRRLKPIYTAMSGEIRFENLLVRTMLHGERTVKVNEDDGVLWIASGKIFDLPKETKYLFPATLDKEKAFATLKIVSPYQGIVCVEKECLTINSQEKKVELDLVPLIQKLKNCSIRFIPLVQNYQYVDKYTVICTIEIFPNYEGFIHSVRKKEAREMASLFIITEDDIWKTNSDQVNNFSFFPGKKKKAIVRSGTPLNQTAVFSRSGFFLKKDGFKMIFQNATPVFLTRGTILNYKQGDLVFEKEILATLVNYLQQTEDIVQGLPKIEELVEARRPTVKKCVLSVRPGVFLSSTPLIEYPTKWSDSVLTVCLEVDKKKQEKDAEAIQKQKTVKQFITFVHSILPTASVVVFNGCLYNLTLIPGIYNPRAKRKIVKEDGVIISSSIAYYQFVNFYESDLPRQFRTNEKHTRQEREEILRYKQRVLKLDRLLKTSKWYIEEMKDLFDMDEDNWDIFYQEKDGELLPWLHIAKLPMIYYKNPATGSFIFATKEIGYVHLVPLSPRKDYAVSLATKFILDPPSFIDMGEPMSEGSIDVHELLTILFQYHRILDGNRSGVLRTLAKFQLLLVNSIQAIYQSQGVSISSKHIEIIVRQMTAKVVIKASGDSPLLPGEVLRLSYMNQIWDAFQESEDGNFQRPSYAPLLISATNSALGKDGFLSAAGFQETKRVLTKAAIEGSSDWLRGLKECIITGRLIPAGSAFLNYKSYLDNVYFFKKFKV